MSNHSVPDFEIDDDYPDIHTSSGVTTSKKSSTMGGVEDIMELIWQDGQVVVQSQNERRHHIIPAAAGEEETSVTLTGPPVFMQDDEMSSWLQYPLDLDDSSFERDIHLLYTATSTSSVTTAEIRPSPLLPSVGTSVPPLSYQLQNFGHFSRLPRALSHSNNIGNITTSSSSTHTAARASTGVDSNETPKLESMVSRVSDSVTPVLHGGGRTATGSTAAAAETSGATTSGSRSASIEPPPPPAEDRKRKGRETANDQGHAEDVEFESADAKKQASSSTSTKRSRAAEVHNLSERKRRDRINEKMKALQELIPRCNKSDKASMLDEAIEYLKSLQMQVQMMSMGCSMVPMMYPGMPQYMPTMGMGMGMGMRMEMGMNRPIVPYPSLMQGPAMQNAAAVAQMAPRFPIPASYHLPPVPVPDPSRIPATNQPDPMLNSLVRHSSNQPRLPNYSDPYQQYFGLRQSQAVLPQNQGDEQPSSSKPSSCRQGSPGNHQSG